LKNKKREERNKQIESEKKKKSEEKLFAEIKDNS
jgi:hypothetical protein